jgi:hypothetical protein
MDRNNPIVLNMCLTIRHDYGMEKDPLFPWSNGMTENERNALYDEMFQLYKHSFLPVVMKLEYELDGLTDQVATLKAERDKLMTELRFARDQVQTYQNNGRFY